MRELGVHSDEAHAAVGRRAAELGVDVLIGVGAGGRTIADAAEPAVPEVAHARPTPATRCGSCARLAAPGDTVLVKASRAVGLEVVAAASAGSRVVIAMLMAASTAFLVTRRSARRCSSRQLRRQGIGQQIRDDGPIAHPHVAKAGTPTMGGIAIVGGDRRSATCVAHVRHKTRRVLDLGLDADRADRRARRGRLPRRLPRRARPPEPRAAQAGQDARHRRGRGGVRVARARLRAHVDAPLVHPAARRPTSARVGWFVFAILIVYATANAVNLTDGLDGLAAGSSAFVFAAFMIIAFTEFRHPHALRRAAGADRAGARPGDRRGRDVRRVRGLPVVERARPRRSSWATPARSRSAARWPASRCSRAPRCSCRSSPGLPVIETLSVVAQVDLVPRVPPPGAAHGADPPSLRSRRLVGVHGDRAVLALRRHLRRARDRHLLRRLPASPRAGDRVMRAVVIGLAETGIAVTRRLRAGGLGRDGARGRAAARARRTRTASTRRARSVRALVEAPSPARSRDASRRGRSRGAEPARSPRPSGARRGARALAVPIRSEIDLAGERTDGADRRGHRHQRQDDRHDADRRDARTRRAGARSRPAMSAGR